VHIPEFQQKRKELINELSIVAHISFIQLYLAQSVRTRKCDWILKELETDPTRAGIFKILIKNIRLFCVHVVESLACLNGVEKSLIPDSF
jgi:hypothetical protein